MLRVLDKTINRLADYLKAHVASGDLAIDDCDLAASQFMEMCQASLFLPFVFQAAPAPSEERIDRGRRQRDADVSGGVSGDVAAAGHALRRPLRGTILSAMSRDLRPPVDILHYEIVQEQASALGRMGSALEQALRACANSTPLTRTRRRRPRCKPARRKLVMEAGQALWMFVVQREATGLRDSRHIMRTYNVPAEVQRCMGLVPAPSKPA